MIRILNVVACAALLGSAIYAYSIKYETIYHAENMAKLKREIQKERDALGVMKAEWSFLVRPDRVQPLVDKYLELQPVLPGQMVSASALRERAQRVDTIGRKLETLGLDAPTNTPGGDKSAAQSTPASKGGR